MEESDREQRIRERAHKIWMDEGQPDGREQQHWDLAAFAIAQEDALPTMLKPVAPPQPEPIEAVANQADFPTLTDQGEGQQIPSRSDPTE